VRFCHVSPGLQISKNVLGVQDRLGLVAHGFVALPCSYLVAAVVAAAAAASAAAAAT